MPDNATNNKREKTLDRLYLLMDIQSRAIRMTRAQREHAKEIMIKIQPILYKSSNLTQTSLILSKKKREMVRMDRNLIINLSH